jgi:hypothetical protein
LRIVTFFDPMCLIVRIDQFRNNWYEEKSLSSIDNALAH